jgi:membrane protease YdiL (CAAX protease family)
MSAILGFEWRIDKVAERGTRGYDPIMVNFGPKEILLSLLSTVLLTAFAGMFAAWGWLLNRLAHKQPVFPARPLAAGRETSWAPEWDPPGDSLPERKHPTGALARPPWGGWSIVLLMLVYVVVNVAVAETYAVATDRVARVRNPKPAAAKVGLPAAAAANQSETPEFAMAEVMFVNAVANVILIVVLPCLLYVTSRARLADLGLSGRRWWRPAAQGLVGMLIATPAVWLIQMAAITVWEPRGHPLEKMLREQFTVDVAYLAVLSGVILAPIAEEILFRGIIQPWLIKVLTRRAARPEKIDSYVEPSTAAQLGSSESTTFWDEDEPTNPPKRPSIPVTAADDTRAMARAIILTSLIFASLHAPQWPAPIPIFVLSLVLGTVSVRTGSLIAPIVMHAAFNGLSTTAMFVALLSHGVIDRKKLPAPEAIHACIDTIRHSDIVDGAFDERGLIKREFSSFF